ncbi:hypothetical protein PUN28_012482 [Cardiocondyla obscurior]|uniref:Uncharacterized protein n=1 Tax=Cardiocondyla obscurior TaxID=286306 RepID=A0AAW2FEG7_9HYME
MHTRVKKKKRKKKYFSRDINEAVIKIIDAIIEKKPAGKRRGKRGKRKRERKKKKRGRERKRKK